MIYKNIDRVFDWEKEVYEKLKKAGDGLSNEKANYKLSSKSWTLKQIFEHIVLVEEKTLMLITKLLERAGANKENTEESISLESIISRVKGKNIKAQERYEPTGKLSLKDSLNRLDEIHDGLRNLKPRLKSLRLSSVTFPHWLFGKMNLGQWTAFFVLHEERHLKQIESMLEKLPVD